MTELEEFIVNTYSSLTARKQAARLDISYGSVIYWRRKLKGRLKGPRAYNPVWTPAEEEYLREKWPYAKMSTMTRHLGRTAVAITIKKKEMGLYRDSEYYTASTLAAIFGCDPKWLTALARDGFLKGHKAAHFVGPSHPWNFGEEDVVAFIRTYPWLLHPERMKQEHYFRSVVREEWRENPWYTTAEAAKVVGVHKDSILQRLESGELPGHRRSTGKTFSLWRIRQKDLLARFARHDGPEERSRRSTQAMKDRRERAGLPNVLHVVWELVCQYCAERFNVTAGPRVRGPVVAEVGMREHLRAGCRELQAAD